MVPMILHILYGIVGFGFWIYSLGDSNYKDIDDDQIVIYKNGEVLKENFVYLSIQDGGSLKLTLLSIEGDADMYVAQHPKVPSYEPEHYDLHSASCGEDIINVPNSFQRPFVIGIYGHSNYEVTKYIFQAEILKNNNETENCTSYSESIKKENIESRKNTKQNGKVLKLKENTNVNSKQSNYVKNGIFGFLELISLLL